MILFCHILVGALIVLKIKFIPLALFLAFISHYLLDFIPHAEYSGENIKRKRWKNCLTDFLKVFLDISLGILAVSFLFTGKLIIFIGAFFAILSDFLTLLYLIFPSNRFLIFHHILHVKIHFLKNKKISIFWRVATQIITILTICLIL